MAALLVLFFFFKANLLKTLLLVLYALAQTCLILVVLKFYHSTVRKELALNWKQGQQKVETVGSFCAWVQRERECQLLWERGLRDWICKIGSSLQPPGQSAYGRGGNGNYWKTLQTELVSHLKYGLYIDCIFFQHGS